MISYGKQCLDKDDIDALNEVLLGDWLTQGPKVEEFENHLNNYFGSKYALTKSTNINAGFLPKPKRLL